MSKYDKTLSRLIDSTIISTFQELEYILKKLGYKEKKLAKTSGSRVAYYNDKNNHIIRIHKPHPGNELKKYVKKYIVSELKKNNLI